MISSCVTKTGRAAREQHSQARASLLLLVPWVVSTMDHRASLRKKLPFRRDKERAPKKKVDNNSTRTSTADVRSRPRLAAPSNKNKLAPPEAAPIRYEKKPGRSTTANESSRRHTASSKNRQQAPPKTVPIRRDENTKITAVNELQTTKAEPVRHPALRTCIQKQQDGDDHHHVDESREAQKIVLAAAALDSAGNDLCDKGDYDSAMTSYTRALKLKQKSLQSQDVESDNLLASVATSIHNIGYLRQRSGASSQETMAAYRDSLRIKKQVLGDESLSVGKTLNNIASVHYASREFDSALEAYQQAREIMEGTLGAQHLDVATVYSNIGDVYMAQGFYQLAHDQYKLALDIRWMHLDEHHPKVCRLLEKIASIEMDQTVCSEDDEEEYEMRMLDDDQDQNELHTLHTEVEADIKEITDLRRKMALDMVKVKLRILKGGGDDENDGEQPCRTPPHFSPAERSDALSSVKQRLAQLRERKAMGESSVLNRNDITPVKLNMEAAVD